MKVKIGIACIAFDKAFWGFDPAQYAKRIVDLKKLAAKIGATVVAVPKAFQDFTAGEAAAKVLNTADIAILDVAAYPEGKAAMTFFDTLKAPLVLWSRAESEHQANIGHNSFCGANFLAGNLALRGTRFRSIYGELNDPQVIARLTTAVRLVGAAKAAAGAKIGMFGEGIVPKFYDIDVQPKDRDTLKARWGIEFVNIPITDLVARAKSYKAADMTKAAAKVAGSFTKVQVDAEGLDKQARILTAVRDMTKAGKYAGIGIRCWPELQTMYGAWPCPSISILNDMGIPAACEGDPGGALDMLLASKMTKTPTTLLDVVDWDDKKNSFAIWHCGPTACSWADGKTTFMCHNVDGSTPDGKPNFGLPGIVDLQFKPGEVTLFRTLGAIDDEFALQGQLVRAPKMAICGSFGMMAASTEYGRKMDNDAVRRAIFTRGLPHHYTAARGHLFA